MKNTQVSASEVKVNMVAKIMELTEAIAPTVDSGNEQAVKVLRGRIELLRKALSKATSTFDNTVRTARDYRGSDFLAAVETFRKDSDKVGRPRKATPEIPVELTNW
jgi:formiminotetrahydrofolate cyclodeaminase